MAERARIRRILVTKLFGVFDHGILLNLGDRITILHGPNGYGKTVILQMLESLFTGQWQVLDRVPFESFIVEFDDHGVFRVSRAPRSEGALPTLVCSYIETPVSEPRIFYVPAAGVRLNEAESPSPRRYNEPEWLTALRSRLGVQLIRTQRIGLGSSSSGVRAFSQVIADRIKSLLTTYAARSQELDSTFLERLLNEGSEPPLPLSAIEQRLRLIEDKRTQLMELGFLDQEREANKSPPRLDASKLDVLSVYVADTEKKLAVFDELARKVKLLTDIINQRFMYKRLTLSKDTGFIFRSSIDGNLIPLASLSSGEQHELVLFYALLFDVTPNTLVLIDEPELSLHVAWQQHFLDDLGEMVKLSQFDVVLATHSPDIIGKRWDLTVELKGPPLAHAAE